MSLSRASFVPAAVCYSLASMMTSYCAQPERPFDDPRIRSTQALAFTACSTAKNPLLCFRSIFPVLNKNDLGEGPSKSALCATEIFPSLREDGSLSRSHQGDLAEWAFANPVEALLRNDCKWARSNREIVLAAVKQNGLVLYYAKDFQGDREIVLAAIRQVALAFQHASKDLKTDPEIIKAALRKKGCVSEADIKGLLADPVVYPVQKKGFKHISTVVERSRALS
jgi:hypothetical protein